MKVLLLLLAAFGLFAGCEGGEAPRDWAARRGLDSGGPQPDRAVSTPTNEVPHAAVTTAGQEQFWIGLTTALIGLTGIGIAIGVWTLEARRRLRSGGDALLTAIVERLRDEGFEDVDATTEPARLLRGEIVITLSGPVMSEAERRRVVAIGTQEARRGPLPALVVDRLIPGLRRAVG